MAYSKATFPKLKQLYGISQDYKSLGFAQVRHVSVSDRLAADIADGRQMSIGSEKAKSEFLIAPILRELQRNNTSITLFSGVDFSIEMTNC